ncbi:hypothetical protein OF001_U240008 [Pseudomonas sp. OF001]|nr:hypothetical protein OF001_U240008 [Pseudomonas sp. OF001]
MPGAGALRHPPAGQPDAEWRADHRRLPRLRPGRLAVQRRGSRPAAAATGRAHPGHPAAGGRALAGGVRRARTGAVLGHESRRGRHRHADAYGPRHERRPGAGRADHCGAARRAGRLTGGGTHHNDASRIKAVPIHALD